MNFSEYIVNIFNFAVTISIVLAFAYIIYNGINLLNARGNASAYSKAKEKIINSLIGLAILFTSYILLTTINPDLVKINTITVGNISINVPSVTTITTPPNIGTISFTELPIGTLTESILAGTSSNNNGVPCYEYEHKAYDSNGNIILANTIDRNNDKKIDGKDTLLDKDMFYCVKLLDDAIRKKTEVLNKLTQELDTLMRAGCTCLRCYQDQLPPSFPPAEIYMTKGKCPCPACRSFCSACCGSARTGCTAYPSNPIESMIGSFIQYKHDPCSNRLQIECKRQEIRELVNGSKPDQVCYDEEYIKEKAPFNLFTINEGVSRLTAFANYFENQTNQLKQVELSTKEPWGKRLTLAEFHKTEGGYLKKIIAKTTYGSNNISRYCSEFKCTQKTAEGVCVKGEMSDKKRICNIDEKKLEYYFYDGDPATFYFEASYDKEEEDVEKIEENKCSILEADAKTNMFNGLIPIGETVDAAEEWGLEASDRVQKIADEVSGIASAGMAIYAMPDTCQCGNCKHKAANCCIYPYCGSSSGEGCSPCASVSYRSCYDCEPSETKPGEYVSYKGCSSSCSGSMPDEPESQDQYWVCSYRTLCQIAKDLYQKRNIESTCYDNAEDEGEKAYRNSQLAKVGYVIKMDERERRFFDMSVAGEIKDDKASEWESAGPVDLIARICPDYLLEKDESTLECKNTSLTRMRAFDNRFTILEKLNYCRVKMNGCVQGYSYPYKENLSQSYVFTCGRGLDLTAMSKLTILPGFPYPSKESDKYWNCYPYNSSKLTKEQQYDCYHNKDKAGVTTQSCLLTTMDYMDNYYCCQ